MGIGTQAWPGINFNKVQFFRTNVSDEPDRPLVLINAVTAEVDLGAGNFTGFPTPQELAQQDRLLAARSCQFSSINRLIYSTFVFSRAVFKVVQSKQVKVDPIPAPRDQGLKPKGCVPPSFL